MRRKRDLLRRVFLLRKSVLPRPGYDELTECSVCKWQDGGVRGITQKKLRRGCKQACTFCGVVFDAYMTWNEFAQKQMDFMDMSVSFLDDGRTIGKILLRPVLQDQLFGWLAVSRNQDAEKAQVLPRWANQLTGLRLPSGDTSSIKSLSTLKAWLVTCECDHTCVDTGTSFIPGRVIEITGDILSLREDLVGEHKYACLSHCWGADGLAYRLLKANKYAFCQGIGTQHLPKTFQDAVEICRFLGIRFLWIDALCIVQDDIKDWNKAAAAMAEIYRHSYITIAASAARNSHEGCFWINSETTFARPLRRTPALTIYDGWWDDLNILHLILGKSPLLRRAWVYQEKRMSRRMVHFASEQLVWECQHYITWENGVTKEKRQTQGTVQLPNAILPTSRILAWRKTVEEYSGLELTFESDRLPAIAALAKEEIERRPDDTYLAGMWRSTLLEDLVWHRFDGGFLKNSGQRPTQPRPSWSWPSVKGEVIFQPHDPLPSAKIVGLSFTPDGPPQLGGYSEASIILRGPSTEAIFKSTNRYYGWIADKMVPGRSGDQPTALPSKIDVNGRFADFDFMTGNESTMYSDQFVFVFVGFEDTTCWGLILRKRLDDGYERVGLCSSSCGKGGMREEEEKELVQSYIDSLPVKEVKIV